MLHPLLCVICRMLMEPSARCVPLHDCNHSQFHTRCLVEHLETSDEDQCPQCKAPVTFDIDHIESHRRDPDHPDQLEFYVHWDTRIPLPPCWLPKDRLHEAGAKLIDYFARVLREAPPPASTTATPPPSRTASWSELFDWTSLFSDDTSVYSPGGTSIYSASPVHRSESLAGSAQLAPWTPLFLAEAPTEPPSIFSRERRPPQQPLDDCMEQ